MSSNFRLTSKLNSVQCLFLMQWNIAAQGNISKEGQRVGQLCREPNDVWLMMDGKRACRCISLLLVSHKLSDAFLMCAAFFHSNIFVQNSYVKRNGTLFRNPFYNAYTNHSHSSLSVLMIHWNALVKNIFKIKIFIWYIVIMNATDFCALVKKVNQRKQTF